MERKEKIKECILWNLGRWTAKEMGQERYGQDLRGQLASKTYKTNYRKWIRQDLFKSFHGDLE